MDLKGKVAIVTGGAQGIGRAFCEALLENGCKVCISDVNEQRGRKTFEDLEKQYKDRVLFARCDVSVFEEFNGVFEKTIQAFGHVDILVNNAGIINEHDWKRTIEINFTAVVQGIKLAFQYMGKDKGGSGGAVVNVSSLTVFAPFAANPVYCGTKLGVVGVTTSFGCDLYFNETGVTISAVCPGSVDTELFHTFHPFSLNEEEARRLVDKSKLVQPSVIADGLIKVLKDGKNGSILRADEIGLRYAEIYPAAS